MRLFARAQPYLIAVSFTTALRPDYHGTGGKAAQRLTACLRRGFPGLDWCDSWSVGFGEDRRSCSAGSRVGALMRRT